MPSFEKLFQKSSLNANPGGIDLFDLEHELVRAFSLKSNDFLKSLLKRSVANQFLLHEFNSNFGIADVVLGTFKPGVTRQAVRESINPNWVTPLASLKRGTKLTVEQFRQTHGLSKAGAMKRLNEYAEAGFLNRVDSNTFRVTKEYKAVANLVVSIEAKLKDWRKALVQARRYKRFSDFSFVLLDGAQASAAKNHLSLFEAQNVGLVSLTVDKLEFHFIPKKNEKKMTDYYLRINEVAYDHFTSMQTAY